MASSFRTLLLFFFSYICFLLRLCFAEDLTVNYDFDVSYLIASPLGIPEQVIAINGQFPCPPITVTTNNIVSVNVQNNLDEPLLLTWPGIQMRGNCWEDGVPGTNCPIPAGWNWTYVFQVKDQIGSYFYFPSLNLQRSSGGFGGFAINNREDIPVPFSKPAGDIFLFISDWYAENHTALRTRLDDGMALGMPHGVLFNGKGSCQYNASVIPDGIVCEKIIFKKGTTHLLRVHNVGVSKTLNLRIQNHSMTLVETEGSYINQQNYTNLDIHVGQSYSFLLTMDQPTDIDYYIIASVRFVNQSVWQNLTSVALLCYDKCKENPKLPLLAAPDDEYDKTFSMNQARSIRWNVSASGARPNPQGSFKYGNINVTQLYVLKSKLTTINGIKREAINGVSFINPTTPMRLADAFKNVTRSYSLDFHNSTTTHLGEAKMKTSIINGTYKGFMEIIFQNNDTSMRSYHLDGYAFFVVGMDYGEWTENSRGTYNKWDGVARCTTQVFPNAWTAILVSLDNVGIWNLRVENLDSQYLGQETYIKVANPDSNKTELSMPSNVLYCGALQKLQKKQRHHGSAGCRPRGVFTGLLLILCSFIILFLQ